MELCCYFVGLLKEDDYEKMAILGRPSFFMGIVFPCRDTGSPDREMARPTGGYGRAETALYLYAW